MDIRRFIFIFVFLNLFSCVFGAFSVVDLDVASFGSVKVHSYGSGFPVHDYSPKVYSDTVFVRDLSIDDGVKYFDFKKVYIRYRDDNDLLSKRERVDISSVYDVHRKEYKSDYEEYKENYYESLSHTINMFRENGFGFTSSEGYLLNDFR